MTGSNSRPQRYKKPKKCENPEEINIPILLIKYSRYHTRNITPRHIRTTICPISGIMRRITGTGNEVNVTIIVAEKLRQ
jgi:hypothetical protein